MKTKRCVYAIMVTMLMVIVAGTAAAEGLSQQAGPFATYQNTQDMEDGYGVGVKYLKMFQDVVPKLDCGVDVRASWLAYDGDDNDFRADLDIIPLEVFALVRYEVLAGTRSYVGVGLGYYVFDSDYIDIDDDIGFSAMVGCDKRIVDTLSVFAEVRYLWLEPDVNTEADIDLEGVGANIGIALNW
jgi:hypothetical protein